MKELFDCAKGIAEALTPERRMEYPAIAVLFDGGKFCGAVPIQSWQTMYQDITIPFDQTVCICYETPPEWTKVLFKDSETTSDGRRLLLNFPIAAPAAHPAGV